MTTTHPRHSEERADIPVTAVADGARGAVLVPIENGMWAVTQTSPDRERLAGADAFVDAALDLWDPSVGRLIAGAKPVGAVTVSPTSSPLRRHRHEGIRGPRGMVVIGDALATFSPLDARGPLATEAAARALREALGQGISRPTTSRRAQQAIAEEVARLWSDPRTGRMGASRHVPVASKPSTHLSRARAALSRMLPSRTL